MSLKGRVAFITGAGGGIGRQTAIALAKEGVNIVLFGGNNLEKLNESESLAQKEGVKTWIFAGNLTDDKTIAELFNKAVSATGGLDILINNAGMAYNAPIEETDIEIYDKIMNINARVPFVLIKLALPYLKKSDRASVLNVTSVVAHAGYPLQSAYTASKHALLGLTKSLAAEVYKDGIRVHAVSPGGVYTDMVKIARPDLTGDGMTTPEEIAEIITFILKHRGNAVVDEIIVHRANKQPFLV